MTIDGAIIREQGATFVVVKPSITSNATEAAKTRTTLQAQVRDFRGLPLILASQDARGVFEYQGRRDIVGFLASIDAARIPWQRYSIS